MPLVTLSEVLTEARARGGYAVGLVCLSWDDAEAFVAAGELAGVPVILSAGPGARAHMPVPIWGAMFRHLAERSAGPVVAHLDHGANFAECRAALDAGFSSVMYDGSALPLAENLDVTRQVVRAARMVGASVEAEVGIVGYADGSGSTGTNPADAAAMASLDIDALAVSLGNVHLQDKPGAQIDWDLAQKLADAARMPLVIHGGSGVASPDRVRLAEEFGVAKINIGTEMRQAYGRHLRATLRDAPELYDRLAIARAVRPGLIAETARLLSEGWRSAR
ncbi:MAG: class II fructose-bisphosphate aldolase [Pseudomonadota bacterium]